MTTRRSMSKINILDEKERANEKLYFTKQDEALLKKIFEAAQLSSEGDMSSEGIFKEATTTEEKIKMVFMKNGIPPSANPQVIADLVKIFDKI